MTALVALHGFTGTPAMWSDVLPDAETPALLGHGDAAPPGASRCYWTEVDRLAEIVRRRVGEGSHLVGYSMGGRVALGLALRHSELVSRLTLIGASPGLEDEAARRQREEWEASLQALLERGGIEAFVDAWESLPLWDSQRTLPVERLAAQREARRGHDARGLHAALGALGLAAMPNLWPMLPEVRARTHLIAGALDHKFRSLAEEMAARIPAARVSAIPGAGHNPVLETPRALARVIREEEA